GGGGQPGRPRGRARPAGRQHLPPRPELAVRRDRRRGRRVGRRDRRPTRAALRGGRAPRRRGQRGARAQRGGGGAARGRGAGARAGLGAAAPASTVPLMSKVGRYVKATAKPGEADALAERMLAVAEGLRAVPGCELYLVNRSPEDGNAVWVTEVWSSQEEL